jgi:hypothetical protein
MSDHDRDPEELSAQARELLARARRARSEEHAPSVLRQRALSRALAELTGPEPTLSIGAGPRSPAALAAAPAPLVPVRRPSLRLGTSLLAALALGLGLFVSARTLLKGAGTLGPEPRASGDFNVSGPAGELLAPQSPLLRTPLLPLPEGTPAASGPSLLAARPFSAESTRAWQVRRWNDPKADPEVPAAHDFEAGALCLTLAASERVVGGWPWPYEGEEAPAKVALHAGRAYRLAFTARASGALPSQVLIGVGHTAWPFVAAAGARVQVSSGEQPFAMDFVAQRDDEDVGIAFLAAASHADGTRLCLRDVVLSER